MLDLEGNKEQILEGLKKVRESGEVNMLNRKGVQRVANDLGFYDLVVFIEDYDARDYMEMLKLL